MIQGLGNVVNGVAEFKHEKVNLLNAIAEGIAKKKAGSGHGGFHSGGGHRGNQGNGHGGFHLGWCEIVHNYKIKFD